MKRNKLVAVIAISSALSALLAGCGDDAESTDSSSPATTAAASITITAADYAYSGVPKSIKAGTKLLLTNSSKVEVHEMVAVALPADETRTVAAIAADGRTLGTLLGSGPPSAVVVAAPMSSQPGAVVGDGSLSQPGRYLLICTIPTGANPAAYMAAAAASKGGPVDVPGGPPHAAQGMFAEVTVEK